ncbi:MAG: hypothetical protein AAF830_01955 [Pseudomonadota bacterium]
MTSLFRTLGPQLVGLICAAVALILGFVYLLAGGAPVRYLVVNFAAFLFGLGILIAVRTLRIRPPWMLHSLLLLFAGAQLFTALGGLTIEGASRWIAVGPVLVQPSFVFLPFMLVSFARHRDAVATLALVLAALAIALQPDRGMAGVFVAAVSAQLVLRPDRHALTALMVGLAAFLATILQPDTLPAVLHVERVLSTSFDIHVLAGLAVTCGAVLLVLPALKGLQMRGATRDACFVFGATWAAALLAAVLGNYPTPVVGYSGAAVLGYLLSIVALPKGRPVAAQSGTDADTQGPQSLGRSEKSELVQVLRA